MHSVIWRSEDLRYMFPCDPKGSLLSYDLLTSGVKPDATSHLRAGTPQVRDFAKLNKPRPYEIYMLVMLSTAKHLQSSAR